MKKVIAVVGVVLVFAMFFTARWYQQDVNAAVENQAVFMVDQKWYLSNGEVQGADVAPFNQNGRVYVPVRYLGYALGMSAEQIAWNEGEQSVTFTAGSTVVKLTVGSKLMDVNGEKVTMDVATLERQDRVFIPARWLAEALGYEVGWNDQAQAVLVGPPGKLPTAPDKEQDGDLPKVGSYENLAGLLQEMYNRQGYSSVMVESDGMVALEFAESESANQSAPMKMAAEEQRDASVRVDAKGEAIMPAPEAVADAAGEGGGVSGDYSKTNVQVQGVDEADIVKTDGKYIYYVSGSRVFITEAYPPGNMKIVGRTDFSGVNFQPIDMYVDGNDMIIIGHSWSYVPGVRPYTRDLGRGIAVDAAPGIYPPIQTQRNTVKAIVCDISDKTSIKQVRELELEGNYISSRKIGSAFYLLANKYLYYYPGNPIENPQPTYRDTAGSNDFVAVDYRMIGCFPNFTQANYLLIAGIDLNKPEEAADINSYLGAGDSVYASTQNLYVAVNEYDFSKNRSETKTKVYRFGLNKGKVTYANAGEVPGTIVNQFSMDEHKGVFRIATTSGDMWRDDEFTSKNNVYNLDSNMNLLGKIEGIAPGERIYSVRFMGDRGYMVTFKTVDPFFVIDLKDPAAPRVLGALKIPGYSDYLHPYDDNHIIGFGKDTIEIGPKGSEVAYYLGMKMAVFDVTDVSNPVEKFVEKIGGRGTESPLLYNHKALLFSKEKNLLALPITLMEVKGPEVVGGFPTYGTFTFQGAYVYDLNLNSGFTLKGRITHLSDQDYLMAGSYWYGSDKNVDRIIYISDVLYTLSAKMIKANNLNNLTELNALNLN